MAMEDGFFFFLEVPERLIKGTEGDKTLNLLHPKKKVRAKVKGKLASLVPAS